MWRRWVRFGLALAAALTAGAASSARADPIRVVYRVDVFRQCEFANSTETCRDFNQSFPLTLTFDSEVTIEHGDGRQQTRFYGEPTLSSFSLPLRDDFPVMGAPRRTAAETARFSEESGVWRRESLVEIRQDASVDRNDFHRDLQITASGEFAIQPELTAQSFARFLGTAPFHQFFVADSIELATGGFELLGYFGRLSIEDDPPLATPEPGSFLLVAGGMVCLRRIARRRSSDDG
jgi:hypothetical protein